MPILKTMFQSTIEQFFHEFFVVADPSDPAGSWKSPAAILMAIKERAGGSFKAPAVNSFGRTLSGIPDLPHRHTEKGSVFCVKPRF